MAKCFGLGSTSSTHYIYTLVDPCQYRFCAKSVSPESQGIDEPRWSQQVIIIHPHVPSLVLREVKYPLTLTSQVSP
jgi:hypothetical protein